MLKLPHIEVSGSPTKLGYAQGEALRDLIQAFVAQRLRAAKAYLWERGTRDLDGLLAAGAACHRITGQWDADSIAEHNAIAEAAHVDPIELFTTANMTDVRDVLLYGETPADAEGCTSLALPRNLTANNHIVAAQTWDLNPPDVDYVVAINRRPSHGPQTWTVTCAGCQTLVGMNANGLWVGTTNIKTKDARPGVPYLSLLHGAIQQSSYQAATTLIAEAPRAGAHTYWLADENGAAELECSAQNHVQRDLGEQVLVQTNHCLAPEHIAMQGEEPNSSSLARIQRANEAASAGNHNVESIKRLFADRSDGVDSINRYAEDNQGTATNACMIGIPAQRELWACRGPSDRGEWIRLPFATT